MSYKDKEFKSVSSSDLGIEDSETEKNTETEELENKELFEKMTALLSDKVTAVRISKRLKSHPVCLANEGEISIEMEKILSAMPNNENIKANKILEINGNHQVFEVLKDAYKNDSEKFGLFTELLYNQALLIEGLPINDPVEFTNSICKLMI